MTPQFSRRNPATRLFRVESAPCNSTQKTIQPRPPHAGLRPNLISVSENERSSGWSPPGPAISRSPSNWPSEIGRASCRERQEVEGVTVAVQKENVIVGWKWDDRM